MATPLVHPLTKYIGPTVALQEMLYGLFMALGTVSAVSLGIGLEDSSRWTLVLAALGINITWGLADMMMYMVTKNFDRMRHQRMADAIKMESDEDWPLDAIEEDLSETIVATLDPADRERIYLDVLDSESRAVGAPLRFSAGHIYGAFGCLFITILATVPLIIPIIFLEPLELGLRVASTAAIVLLFLTGYLWAPYAGLRKWKAGMAMMGVGVSVTVATLVLGG